MMAVDLKKYSNQLSFLCAAYSVKRLELFGSATRQDFDKDTSDLDFLIEFTESHPKGAFDRYFAFKEALEDLFQRPIDLVEIKAISNPYFRQAVEQEKVLVYGT
jgi:predicted nucleotidyltransferase